MFKLSQKTICELRKNFNPSSKIAIYDAIMEHPRLQCFCSKLLFRLPYAISRYFENLEVEVYLKTTLNFSNNRRVQLKYLRKLDILNAQTNYHDLSDQCICCIVQFFSSLNCKFLLANFFILRVYESVKTNLTTAYVTASRE